MMHCKLILTSSALGLGTIFVLAGATSPPRTTSPHGGEIPLAEARIFFEYNSTDNDLGVHVFLDGEDWRKLKIENPDEHVIFEVKGKGPYRDLGLTELFFEGAEPSLDEFPLQDLLDLFPEGEYEFSGRDVDGQEIESTAMFTHAIPDGPDVSAQTGANNFLRLSWSAVTGPPAGFPNEPIRIAGYQIIVDSYQVTLPSSARSVTVSPEFVAALGPGQHSFEVLAIEQGGNQTITQGSFTR